QAPDAAAPLRMQGVYVSDAAINRITRYWKGIMPDTAKPNAAPASALSSPVDFNRPAEPVQSRTERFSAPATPPDNVGALSTRVFGNPSVTSGNGDSNGEDDEMYEEALEMVKRAGKPSIQMLQRRLRIGYTRAARLIELMEKRGAISSADARNASASS